MSTHGVRDERERKESGREEFTQEIGDREVYMCEQEDESKEKRKEEKGQERYDELVWDMDMNDEYAPADQVRSSHL